MGKKSEKQKSTTTKAKKTSTVVKEKVVEEPEKAADSLLVAAKKANDVKIKKQIKKMNAKVLEHVDLKQVVSAVKALQTFTKK